MQKLKIEARTQLEIEIYGRVFNITRPSLAQVEAVYEKLSALAQVDDKLSASDVWRQFFGDLGMDVEFLKGLEKEHMLDLIDFVTGSKKKS